MGRVLVGDQIALPSAFLVSAFLADVSAGRPEIGVAAEDDAVAKNDEPFMPFMPSPNWMCTE
jgi:hypothetical protein